MKTTHTYYVYILTNSNKTTLYIGVTNNLEQRIIEHYLNRGNSTSFAGKYFCHFLLYYESFGMIQAAIAREKELKRWSRHKKTILINITNPEWKFLNKDLFDQWPPREPISHRGIY
ncbi:GIY-YIG nuclease family protein [Paraflavitalea soli]|uniref:GIY-YIG nuclease family protein n=1 Tax=Paraflavitalea soli TaxID=2315862 RepID=A0A3B7MMQ9_9BACT|nr:GIY-YIG nuclease family protein [Paraflavitalea soli]AXY72905.1 GIY-YIG nuclease family protein [Paraflavitalea soli]